MIFDTRCKHLFEQTGRVWFRRRWTCIYCRFETRTYDGADRAALRPLHEHMSVAFPGYNTVRPMKWSLFG